MSIQDVIPEKILLDQLADESGLAIAIVDDKGQEISVSNNNSICRNLNPGGKFTVKCAAFCGTALEETTEVGGPVSFTCHAGLECRAVPIRQAENSFVAIIGRTFVTAENYRRATTRAISGDWSSFAPAEFFENILLSNSIELVENTAEKLAASVPELPKAEPIAAPEVEVIAETEAEITEIPVEPTQEEATNIVEKFNREILNKDLNKDKADTVEPAKEVVVEPVIETETEPTAVEAQPEPAEKAASEARAWRAFFGSLLKTDYPKAADSILEFLAHHYSFKSLVWLEKINGRLENTTTFGEMKGRKVRLGISPDDKRLIEASQNEMPLELGEKQQGDEKRIMHLFPIGVGGEISAAIATLDPIKPEAVKKHIARICHSIAPQLEILRLRSEVASQELLGGAVQRFSESIKTIDDDDFWLKLTQNAAEMLQAERASLLVFDDRAEALNIKALIGSRNEFDPNDEVGSRVAKIVFDRNEAVAIEDVATTGLSPVGAERNYKTRSFMSCPVNIGGRAIGVMSFTDRATGKPFDRASLDLFQAISPQLAVAIDRATLKEKAGTFEQLSVTDALTGLLNRRYIEERLMEETKRSNRHGFPMSFMMLDVDQFKSYNDSFGHPAGDEALKIVGSVIRDTLRGADVAARFGGEEFAILLPQTIAEEAITIAERIRSNIEETDFPHRRVTLSIGVASCSAELCSAKNIVSAADKALYGAKHGGRNRVRSFEEMNGIQNG